MTALIITIVLALSISALCSTMEAMLYLSRMVTT